MKRVSWTGSIIGGISGLVSGYAANNVLYSMTDGIWSMEKGAPWVAIYAVFILPAFLGFVCGLYGIGSGIVAGIISAIVTAIIDFFVCIIIGLFLDGQALNTVVSIIVLSALLGGPGTILVIFIKK